MRCSRGLPHRIDLGPAELSRFDDGTFVARYDVKRECVEETAELWLAFSAGKS